MANRHVGLELCVAVGFIAAAAPALADPHYCSTSFQGYRVCSSPGGYRSTEAQWWGLTFGWDNRGARGLRWRWQGLETTTVGPR